MGAVKKVIIFGHFGSVSTSFRVLEGSPKSNIAHQHWSTVGKIYSINPSHFLDIFFLFWGDYHVDVVKNVVFYHLGLFLIILTKKKLPKHPVLAQPLVFFFFFFFPHPRFLSKANPYFLFFFIFFLIHIFFTPRFFIES